MKRKGNFLITENSQYDIVNIKYITYIAKHYNKVIGDGSRIYTVDNRICSVKEKPEKVLDMISRKKKE